MCPLISFGSKEEVRIVAVGYPRFVFLGVLGKQSVFLCAESEITRLWKTFAIGNGALSAFGERCVPENVEGWATGPTLHFGG